MKTNYKIQKLGLFIVVLMPLLGIFNFVSLVQLGGLSIRGTDLIFLLANILIIIGILLQRKLPKPLALLWLSVLFLIVLGFVVETYLGNYMFNIAKDFRFYETLLWGGVGYYFINNEKKLSVLINSVILAMSVLACFSIYLYITIPGLHRIAGFFSYANGNGLLNSSKINGFNEIGALFSVSLFLILYAFQRISNNKYLYIFYFLAFFLNIVGLLLAQSRSAILAIVMVVLLFGIHSLDVNLKMGIVKINKKSIKYIAIVSILSIISIYYLLPHLNLNRIFQTFNTSSSSYNSMITRLSTWVKGYETWMHSCGSFLIGNGSGSLGINTTSENFFLDNLVIRGIMGTGAVIAIIIYPFMLCSRRTKQLQIMIALIALIVSLTGNVLVDPFYGGLTFLLLYSCCNLNKDISRRIGENS